MTELKTQKNVTATAIVVAVTAKIVIATATATKAKNVTVVATNTTTMQKKNALVDVARHTHLKQLKKQQNNQPVLRTNKKLAMDNPIASFI